MATPPMLAAQVLAEGKVAQPIRLSEKEAQGHVACAIEPLREGFRRIQFPQSDGTTAFGYVNGEGSGYLLTSPTPADMETLFRFVLKQLGTRYTRTA